MSASVSAAQCAPTETGFDCNYSIDGQDENSAIDIVSEGGLTALANKLFFDPLILEVPAGVISATGTYDSGSGPHALLVSRANSFPVQPGTRITAEVGTTFLFLEVPASVSSGLPISNPAAGPVLSYTLAFMQNVPLGPPPPPVTVKPMMAGSLTVKWHLATRLGDILRAHSVGPCNHAVYDFTSATPPPGLLFLPFMRR